MKYVLTNVLEDSKQGRLTLKTCGLRPQTYTSEMLETMGMFVEYFRTYFVAPLTDFMNSNIAELKEITPTTALDYHFYSNFDPFASSSDSEYVLVGRDSALRYLLSKGHSLASQAWVDNHWSLILWKLAGMVALDPAKESDPNTRRWSYTEVMRQLLYRFVTAITARR